MSRSSQETLRIISFRLTHHIPNNINKLSVIERKLSKSERNLKEPVSTPVTVTLRVQVELASWSTCLSRKYRELLWLRNQKQGKYQCTRPNWYWK